MTVLQVPILSVFLSAVVATAVGMAWYSPYLFGRAWMSLSGMSPEKIDEGRKRGMIPVYFASFAGGFVMAFIVGYVLTRTFSASLADGVRKAVLLWAGFVAPVLLGSVLWEGKSLKLYLINAGYYLAVLILTAIIMISTI